MSHKNKEFGISSWAVDNRVTVYILTLLIVITGVIAYVTMPREDFPEIIENKVYISSVFMWHIFSFRFQVSGLSVLRTTWNLKLETIIF